MSEESKKLDLTDLEKAAGGNDGEFGPTDSVHNLAYYDEHVVAHLPEGTRLVSFADLRHGLPNMKDGSSRFKNYLNRREPSLMFFYCGFLLRFFI